MDSKYILGIDGGGTKTVAALASVRRAGEYELVGRGTAASSNIKALGMQHAMEHLATAVREAWRAAQQEPQPVCFAVLGLSGAGRTEDQQAIADWIAREKIATSCAVVHDAAPVLAAGCSRGWGVALVAGTGAVAYGTNSQGDVQISGGWGYWFGDEGSAFWIGREALRGITRASDGRGMSTALTATVLEQLGLADPRAILSTLGSRGDVRQQIAELAAVVSEVAERDALAEQILKTAAGELAELVRATVEQLGMREDFQLALAGGVVCGSELVRRELMARLVERKASPATIEIVADPALGCLQIASRRGAS